VTHPRIEPILSHLSELEPDSVPVLDVLDRRGTLHAYSGETGQLVAEFLGTVRATPRGAGMDPRHVYWGLLERLYNPSSNTQIVNVSFREGELDTRTCVSAAHIFAMILTTPGEYARIVERLTSPEAVFGIVRSYPPGEFENKCQWLSSAFSFRQAGERTLQIWIHADPDAPTRAIAEQEGRWFREYDFGVREQTNSRLLVDVMVQSALTNYMMRGEYDSAGDCDRVTGERGIAVSGDSPGYRALLEDIRRGPTPHLRARRSLYLGVMSEEQALQASRDAWTGGYYLDQGILIDIDHNRD
jgi:hypothetical protein